MSRKLTDDERKRRKKESAKKYYEENKELVNSKHKKYASENKGKIKAYISEYRKEYRKSEKSKEYTKSYNKKYSELNKEKRKKYRSNHQKEKRKNDPLYKLTGDIRSLIGQSIRKMGYSKKSKTFEILGCSFEEFKIHLESQFQDGMSWENHGEWHMDHIKPISLAENESEVIILNHYTNFQPLWALDNLEKYNKYNVQHSDKL